MKLFGKDIAVSLVDDSFIFSTQSDSLPLVLPAYVAIQSRTTKVVACGDEAKAMLGREPGDISVISVLTEGIINNYEAAVSLFRFGLRRLAGRLLVRPRVLIARRPYDPGKRAVYGFALAGGAREVYLIEIGMATALGMHLERPDARIKGRALGFQRLVRFYGHRSFKCIDWNQWRHRH